MIRFFPSRWVILKVALCLGILALGPSTLTQQTNSSAEDIELKKNFMRSLTADEREWLRSHPIIKVVLDPDWPPVEFMDESGTQSGMSMDYLNLIEKRLDVRFERITGMVWSESFDKLKKHEIDMTTCVAETSERKQFWSFTKPYLSLPIVIATQSDVTYISDIRELRGKRIAVVRNFAIDEWLAEDYPELTVVRVSTPLDGLQMLQRGEVFAYIDNLLVIGYYQAKMKVSTIKISGQTRYVNEQGMAVRSDWAPLATILDKALASIPEKDRNAIYRKWLPVRYEYGFNYQMLWQVAGGFLVVITILIVWNRQLAREVKQRRLAESALIDSEGKYRALIEGLPDVVMRFDRDGRYLYASSNITEVIRIPVDQLIGKTHRELGFPDTHCRTWEEAIWRTFMNAEPNETEITYQQDTEETIHNVRLIPEFDPNNKVKSVICITRDITEQKKSERRIIELNESLEQRVQDRTAQLNSVIEELDSFSYSVSHDLRSPLRAIDGFSKQMEEDYGHKLTRDGKETLGRIRAAVHRMGDLIDGLLSLARLSRSQLAVESVNLSEIAFSVLQSLRQSEPNRSVAVVIADNQVAQTDPILIQTIFENLFDNAWKYTSKTQTASIEFGSFDDNGEMVFFVRDNGTGFDMTYVDKIFGAFQRLHTQDDFPGTGIGLATVKRIVNRLGGRIWADSVKGEGATFYFTLGTPVSSNLVTH